jgi:hypothetical protein
MRLHGPERESNQPASAVAPAPSPPHALMQLQATAGNQAVTAMLARGGRTLARDGANYAKTSPQAEYSGILHNEVDLLNNAKAIVAWLRARHGGPGAAVTVTAGEIVGDSSLVKKLKPKPKEEGDVRPTLDLMVYYGVLKPAASGFDGVLNKDTGDLDTARLDGATGEITALTKDFDERAAKKDSVDPITLTGQLDPSLAAGAASEKKEDKDAQKALADVEAQLNEHVVLCTPDPKGKARAPITRVMVDKLPDAAPNAKGVDVIPLPVAGAAKPVEVAAADVAGIEPVASGASADTAKLRTGIEAKLEKAKKRLARAQGYRTFAIEVIEFLERLRTRNTTWVGGTYPHHSWGEFSVDIFLNVGEDKEGFYKVGPTETFFDDLDETAQEDGEWGTFQWRAVYNDDRIIKAVGDKYGKHRISKAPHHGPAPDKLHIHLDLRPDKLQPDAKTGFHINDSGRVQPI